MKTPMEILLEEIHNYKNESGNDNISISLLSQGINGIYKNLEKQQIIEAYSEGMGHYGDANSNSEAGKYYNKTFNTTNKETLK